MSDELRYIQEQLARIDICPSSQNYSWEAALDAAVNECESFAERHRQMEEEIEALHIALRASGERREQAERQVRELEQQVKVLIHAVRMADDTIGWITDASKERYVKQTLRKALEAGSSGAEDTSDFYLDSFHRTWNREF